MKKILLALSAVALLFATSCKKESVNPAIDVPEGSFLATIDNGANPQNAPVVKDGMGTMTTIDANRYVIWEPDDEIKINGKSYTTNTSGNSVVFAPKDLTKQATGTTFHAFYPASIAGTGAAGYLSPMQKIVVGKVNNLPMYACSNNNQLTFHNICAVLKITIPSFLNGATTIQVSSDQCMNGAFTVDANHKAVMTATPDQSNSNILAYISGGSFSENDVVYIAVPAQEYSNLKIKFSDNNSVTMWEKTLATCTLDVNKVYNINVTPSDIPVNCFHFTATGNVTVGMAGNLPVNLEYNKYTASTGLYSGWQPFTVGTTNVSLDDGDKAYFRATSIGNNQFATGRSNSKFTSSGSGTLSANGNIMYLLNGTTPATTLTSSNNYAFSSLFDGMAHLKDASQLNLPATTLSEYCYAGMFAGCLKLDNVPALPAETLATGCYMIMFAGCTTLASVPYDLLPAETLAENCYYQMFAQCTVLENGPELPALTLNDFCYSGMFYGCSSLVNAPVLPAQTLYNYCYNNLFRGCSKLSSATMKATSVTDPDCLMGWLQDAGTDNSVSSRTVHCKSSVQTTVQGTLPTGTYGWTAVGDVQ